MKKCLIIDHLHPCIVPLLEAAGYVVDNRPGLSRPEVLDCISDYQGLIVRSKLAIDQEVINAAPNLHFVGRAGAGLDQLNVDALNARDIAILNAPEGNRDALAEHLIGMLLGLLNHIQEADRQVRTGEWDREGNRGTELMGKTVGLVGYGYMGQAFAQRLSGFGVTVLAYDKYRKDYSDAYATEATMDELHERTDVLSFHVPLTDETQRMVDQAYLDRFKKNIYLLNSARGKILPLATLAEAVATGKVRGAALDVLETEPPARMPTEQRRYFDTLGQSGRVLFTPHVGGWTHESYEKISQVLAQKIVALKRD